MHARVNNFIGNLSRIYVSFILQAKDAERDRRLRMQQGIHLFSAANFRRNN